MDELVALPVKGEAFLLRRGARHILVDGGFNGRRLVTAITAHDPALKKIDVVVCTHADRDHAGGLASFLDNWCKTRIIAGGQSRQVGEFWLPGSWADVIPDLIVDAREFIDGIINELDKVKIDERLADGESDVDDITSTLDRQALAERLPSGVIKLEVENSGWQPGDYREDLFAGDEPYFGSTDLSDEAPWFSDLRHTIGVGEVNLSDVSRAFASGRERVRRRRARQLISRALAAFWLSLIDTAEIIRAIAAQAIQYRVRIRWFDFDEFAKSGRPMGGARNFLIPLNAVELFPIPQVNISYLARLSAVNAACLAFYAPPLVDRLGVVFCGDSPLGGGPAYGSSFLNASRRPRFPIVATAPHHGSENNKAAYMHLHKWADVRIWLRTGGSSRQPGPTFQALRFPLRICTHCPQIGLKLKTASVASSCALPYWRLWITGHRCVCP